MNAPDFTTLMETRRSVHFFDPDFVIADNTFYQILESVCHTPSGYNAQPWQFILIKNKQKLQQIQQIAFGQRHIAAAGAAVVVLGHTDFMQSEQKRILQDWQKAGYDHNQIEKLKKSLNKDRPEIQKQQMTLRAGAMAAMAFLLSAHSHGLATCPMMGFDHAKLLALLDAKPDQIPILLIPVGKKSPSKAERILPRKKAREIGRIEH